jgi:Ca2+-dependent lipid-binding protein
MIEIEIINASLENSLAGLSLDPFCIVKLFGREIARTQSSSDSTDPIWNEKFCKSYSELSIKERIYNRPFFLEALGLPFQ